MPSPSASLAASVSGLPLVGLDRIVTAALEEDIATGDLTTEACIDADAVAVARAVARKELVVCGGAVFAHVLSRVDPGLRVEAHVAEGARVAAGTVLWTASGSARALLVAERTALNFVQRMSGIATQARRYVEAIPKECTTRIADTRKTTPGLRLIERYAVRVGGAHNHRDSLGSAVLIKDNHVAACGGVAAAIQRARARAPHLTRIECEVDSLAQLDQALEAGADIILLDNMDIASIVEAVRRTRGADAPPDEKREKREKRETRAAGARAILEVSGGVTLERIPELARTGVDVISAGALTHSAPAADIGLDFA